MIIIVVKKTFYCRLGLIVYYANNIILVAGFSFFEGRWGRGGVSWDCFLCARPNV